MLYVSARTHTTGAAVHVLAGVAVIAFFIAFAFGKAPARVFVAGVLGIGAAVALFIIFIAAVDINRQSSVKPPAVVHMGSKI